MSSPFSLGLIRRIAAQIIALASKQQVVAFMPILRRNIRKVLLSAFFGLCSPKDPFAIGVRYFGTLQ